MKLKQKVQLDDTISIKIDELASLLADLYDEEVANIVVGLTMAVLKKRNELIERLNIQDENK